MVQPGPHEPKRHNLLWLSLAVAVVVMAVGSFTWHAWLPDQLEIAINNELKQLGFEDTHLKIHELGPPVGRLGYLRAKKDGLEIRIHEIQAEYDLPHGEIHSVMAEGADIQLDLFHLPDFTQPSQNEQAEDKNSPTTLPFKQLIAPDIDLQLKADTWQQSLTTTLELKQLEDSAQATVIASYAQDTLNLFATRDNANDQTLSFNLSIQKTETWTAGLETFAPALDTLKPWGRELKIEGRAETTPAGNYAWALEGILGNFTLGEYKKTFTARDIAFGLQGHDQTPQQAWLSASGGRAQYKRYSAYWEAFRALRMHDGSFRLGLKTLELDGLPWQITVQAPRLQTEPISAFTLNALKGRKFNLLFDSISLPLGSLNKGNVKFSLAGDGNLVYEAKATLNLEDTDFSVSAQGFYAPDTGILTPFFQLDATDLERWALPLGNDLPETLLSGRIALAAALYQDEATTQWVMMLAMDNGEIELPEQGLHIKGLNGEFSFDLMDGQLVIPEQTLKIANITQEEWTLTDITAKLGAGEKSPLGSSKITANLFGGSLTCTIDPVPEKHNTWQLLVTISDLDTAKLETSFPGLSERLQGTLNGEFPILIKDGDISFQQGYLELSRDGLLHLDSTPLGGVMDQVTEAIMTAITQALNQRGISADKTSEQEFEKKLKTAADTLKIKQLRIDLFDKDNPGTPATAHIEGTTTGDPQVPLVIDVNINDVDGQLTKKLKTLIGLLQMLAGNEEGARKLVQ